MAAMAMTMLAGTAMAADTVAPWSSPCSDTPLPAGFIGPPLPPCLTDAMLRDLEMLRMLDVLENWELLGE